MVFTTINNSLIGVLFGKIFAENILKILPIGTHDIKKFISPETLAKEAEEHNIILDNFIGFTPTFKIEDIMDKQFGDFKLSSNLGVNYGAAGIKI